MSDAVDHQLETIQILSDVVADQAERVAELESKVNYPGWEELYRLSQVRVAELEEKLVERSRYISTLHPNVCICHHCTMTREQTDD